MRGPAMVTAVGGPQGSRRRLAELGIRAGSHVRVLSRATGGSRVLAVDGSRIAIDAELARLIEVDPVDA